MAKINKYWGYVAIGALTAAAAGAVAALIAKKGSCKEDFDFEDDFDDFDLTDEKETAKEDQEPAEDFQSWEHTGEQSATDDTESEEAEEAAKYGCKPGQYKPLDLNEDGVIDDKDRVIDGKRTPDWTGGMTNTFTYKEFDLSFQAAFQAGARARNQFYVSYALENNNLNFNNLRKDYWTPENPTNASAQPSNMGTYRSKAGSWGNAKSEMSHTMFSSNFLKISYITLGYTFKPSVLEKMKLGNLRLYATVQNPFILCAKDVVDPEQLNVSINTSDAMTRNVIFGINLSFK